MKFQTFCAANSGKGFISLFDTILDETKYHIYYIKGGPGCGKSTLMREIAESAEEAELIQCSGDPESLDGVIWGNNIIIDATSPHSHEPKYPGVGGTIVDLGQSWDINKLNKERILFLSNQKAKIYSECYSLTASALFLHKSIQKSVFTHLNQARIQFTVDKILRQNALWENRYKAPKITQRFLSAISPSGLITLEETLPILGKNIILLDDRWYCGTWLLKYMDAALTERGIDHINCYHPLLGQEKIQHLIVPEVNLSIVTKDSIFPIHFPEDQLTRKIPLTPYLDKVFMDANKNKLGFLKRMERELLLLGTEKLACAKKVHLQIEQEYRNGTDFTITNQIKEKLICNLFRAP